MTQEREDANLLVLFCCPILGSHYRVACKQLVWYVSWSPFLVFYCQVVTSSYLPLLWMMFNWDGNWNYLEYHIHCKFFGGMHIVLYNYFSQLLSHIVHVFIFIFPPPIFIALESCNQLLNQQLVVAKSSSVLRHTKKMQFHDIGNEKKISFRKRIDLFLFQLEECLIYFKPSKHLRVKSIERFLLLIADM